MVLHLKVFGFSSWTTTVKNVKITFKNHNHNYKMCLENLQLRSSPQNIREIQNVHLAPSVETFKKQIARICNFIEVFVFACFNNKACHGCGQHWSAVSFVQYLLPKQFAFLCKTLHFTLEPFYIQRLAPYWSIQTPFLCTNTCPIEISVQ